MEVLLLFPQELYCLFNSSIETVYGLGANALNQDAVCDIFNAKDRPFNGRNEQTCEQLDPVIVHVLSSEEADKYVDIGEEVCFIELSEF